MNLEKLSNQEIQISLAKSVRKEKEGSTEVVAHLVEVERRKLYLQIGRRDQRQDPKRNRIKKTAQPTSKKISPKLIWKS